MKRNPHELDPRAVRFCLGELDDKLKRSARFKTGEERGGEQKEADSAWRDLVARLRNLYRSLVGRCVE